MVCPDGFFVTFASTLYYLKRGNADFPCQLVSSCYKRVSFPKQDRPTP
nr:MAG TPA: hypothetical protein [Caudoviricetes sp.]